jgi:glycosidase
MSSAVKLLIQFFGSRITRTEISPTHTHSVCDPKRNALRNPLLPLKSHVMEFHVSRRSRDEYLFDDSLFSFDGNIVFADFFAARVFAKKINDKQPTRVALAGEINAMGLIDEISHQVVEEYRRQINPKVIHDALQFVYARLDDEAVNRALKQFAQEFPTVAVYRGERSAEEYLNGETRIVRVTQDVSGATMSEDEERRPNKEIVLEEMMMLWLSNNNPAFKKYKDLFDDTELNRSSHYSNIISALRDFFVDQPRFGTDHQTLIEMLRAPALTHPDSLDAQLDFIQRKWQPIVGKMLFRLLSSRDLIKEDARLTLGMGGFQGMGTPEFNFDEIRAMTRSDSSVSTVVDHEYEAYTQDKEWMPRLVLIAKNSYVWLAQLSKQFGRDISRLDQIPDEELDRLARAGITGLWLIGVWERSRASKRIKQRMGAYDAVASAYSLMGYRIADDLGGESALNNLKERAWRRGIRMGSDMVPNHMGIDSDWVMNHPERFLALDYPPYPNYAFNSEDLSDDSRVGVFIEDHYYNKSDAAVVFKRLDRWTGSAKYIYHGNDGTSMPWNDTAQLNYLDPNVREAVIQTILSVARRFPIIRFDAAMTLAKRHIQRLWFPAPGSGDGIPSRAGLGLTREEMDKWMPNEFWREVVDRAAVEAPDTLLLAEAFWMLEGYFVRTLGMHRVYNSAFMHMLRDEDNAKYRYLIKETLEFDPQILKRYVNFMNNPDEKTAVEQFGKGDKYFGVCAMLVTLPGLPMFGHGQIEGYGEKYGMEYRAPKMDESPDTGLIQHHERVIFPLVHKRYLFSDVENFYLYDFYSDDGSVDENVFAYSNRFGNERGLVVYHNKYGSARGWVRTSAAYLVKGQGMRQTTLGEALNIPDDAFMFTIFRDQISGLEFIRNSKQLHDQGLYVELDAYKCHVFLNFREAFDHDGGYSRLANSLNGRGVPNIDEALREMAYEPVLRPFREWVNAEMFKWLIGSRASKENRKIDTTLMEQVEQKATTFVKAAKDFLGGADDESKIAKQIRDDLEAALRLPMLFASAKDSSDGVRIHKFIENNLGENMSAWASLLGRIFLRKSDFLDKSDFSGLLGKQLRQTFHELGIDENRTLALVRVGFASNQPAMGSRLSSISEVFSSLDMQQFLGVNEWEGVKYFDKDAFERLLNQEFFLDVIDALNSEVKINATKTKSLFDTLDKIEAAKQRAEKSGYKVNQFLVAMSSQKS